MKEYKNYLADEKSPYLLQHAYNPVAWYPWGEEAFDQAEKEGKLVFLSIGYSTCHWCHVMAHESFEDLEVARILNEKYVSIKVDREERPDIDSVYMSVCQMMTGQGGWPLTVILTPEQKPVFAGTYFPKTRRRGMPGLTEILQMVSQKWEKNQQQLLDEAERITSYLYESPYGKEGIQELTKEILHRATGMFQYSYDKTYGGFQRAPKFPTPHNLLFLLRYGEFEQQEQVLEMAYHTLISMYRGGIFDHVGGGFSRYSTDDKWLIPHFEKMLYDNALLTYVYLEAYQISQNKLFGHIARRTMGYMLQELTADKGGFFCGQDADSEGEEGKFYVFSKEEIFHELGQENGTFFCHWYHVTDQGNFEGKNVLNLLANENFEEINSQIAVFNEKMEKYRGQRTKLHRDDKVLTAWNGLAIAAFAKGYQVLFQEQYLRAAVRAEEFVMEKLSYENGRLKIRYRDGESIGMGHLDDYACLAWAELELYRATFQVGYLEKAVNLVNWMLQLFWDKENKGFYFYASDAEQLISRPKELYDGAMPSGNSVAAAVLVQMEHMTGEDMYRNYASQQLAFLAGNIWEYPAGYSFTLLAMIQELYEYQELVCVAEEESQLEPIKKFLSKRYHQNLVVLIKTRENAEKLAQLCPYTVNYPVEEGKEVYYLCRNGACMPKIYELEALEKLLAHE